MPSVRIQGPIPQFRGTAKLTGFIEGGLAAV
jgi:hypothetical protein